MNKKISARIRTHFDSAHFLPNYEGECKNMHGHHWVVEIELTGEINKETGMLVDFKTIKDVVKLLDHKLLNEILPYPTAELIATYIVDEIRYKTNNLIDVKVRLWESPDCCVEVTSC